MAHSVQRIPDREILIDGQSYLYFGGTAYLGLQNYAPFKELYLTNVSKFGMHYGASRKANIALDIYKETEDLLAHWVGSEGCLSMSSGYLAAQLVVDHFIKKGHPVIATPDAHTALRINGVMTTQSFDELETLVSQKLSKNALAPVILFDTIDFSGKLYPNFDGLRQLPLEQLILVGDDSHGIGLVGSNGNGCFDMLQTLGAQKLLVCCSLGKAMGIQAGAVFGNLVDIEVLESTPFFGGASPASPAFMATLLGAKDLYSERLRILGENYHHFRSQLKSPSFFVHLPGHPTFEFQNAALASRLEQKGFLFTNFNYPDANGPLVSRIVLSAYHTKKDIEQLCIALDTLLP